MPLFDHFNFLAPFYDRVIPFNHAQKIAEIMSLPTSGLLLDAGGGTGRVAYELRDGAKNIIVADISIGMLIQTNSKNGMVAVNCHTEKLPFVEETFSRIIMVDALHHVCDHSETLYELWRVLKTGGRIVIEEPDIRRFPVKLVALAEKLALMRSHFINPDRIANYFRKLNSEVMILTEDHNSWVVIDKQKK